MQAQFKIQLKLIEFGFNKTSAIKVNFKGQYVFNNNNNNAQGLCTSKSKNYKNLNWHLQVRLELDILVTF